MTSQLNHPDSSRFNDETETGKETLGLVVGREYIPSALMPHWGARVRLDSCAGGKFSLTITRSGGTGSLREMRWGDVRELQRGLDRIAPSDEMTRDLSPELRARRLAGIKKLENAMSQVK